MAKKTKRNPKDYINVAVLRTNHELIKEHLDAKKTGEDIGKFYDMAAVEKMQREVSDNLNVPPFKDTKDYFERLMENK